LCSLSCSLMHRSALTLLVERVAQVRVLILDANLGSQITVSRDQSV
jgi:hypothetical protein